MNEKNHNQHQQVSPNGGHVHHDHGPYWKRAHRDWRLWFCVILMLVLMLVYLGTGDFRWRLSATPEQPVSSTLAD